MFIQAKRIPLLVSFAALAFAVLTMLILSVVMIVRTVPVPAIQDLPDRYLPGNPLPRGAVCDLSGERNIVCHTYHFDEKVHFTARGSDATIISTSISARKYAIGDLITAWGTPTGITQNNYYTYVYWGTRSVFLLTNSFQPTSRVDLIMYTLEQEQSSPWRGFTNRKR